MKAEAASRGSFAAGPEEVVRLAELDGVRGVAILLVLLHHYCKDIPANSLIDQILRTVAEAGWIGVDLFFVLSGYLITGILLDLRGSPGALGAFYARRALRILPPYYVLLFLVFLAGPGLGVSLVGNSARDSMWFWLFGSNFLIAFEGWPHRILAPLWSLAIEEHFYVLWPFMVFAVPAGRLPAATILIASSSVLARFVGSSLGWSASANYVLTFTRLDALALGGLLATLMRSRTLTAARLSLIGGVASLGMALVGLAAVLSGCGLWGSWEGWELVWGYLGLAIGIAGFVAWLLNTDVDNVVHRLLRLPALTLVGRRSYAMYLFHMPLVEIAARLGLTPASLSQPGLSSWPYFLAHGAGQTALVLLAAEASWRLIERPLLRLKRTFPYVRSPPYLQTR